MAEVAPAAPAKPAAPTKAAKKKMTAKATKSGPSVNELILRAVSASKERNGVSLPALKKFLVAGGYDVEKNKARVKIAVRNLVTKGALVQTKGTGASGSFKMNKNAAEPRAVTAAAKKSTPQKKKPAAKKAPAAAKKVVATKKSPNKAKKTLADKSAAKDPKKTSVSPKKEAKKKAQPMKKSPVKKAAKPKARKAASKKN